MDSPQLLGWERYYPFILLHGEKMTRIKIESLGELPDDCDGWVVKIEENGHVEEITFGFFEEVSAFLEEGVCVDDSDRWKEGLATDNYESGAISFED